MGKYHSRLQVRIREFERRTIRYFGGLSLRDTEYDFVYRQVIGEGGSVLDVGGSESLLPLQLSKRGFRTTVYDFREYPEKHTNLSSIQGDFLVNKIPDHSFDYVVMISAIEHIGFGSYGAPAVMDGDFQAMEQAKRIVKPSGRIIITFPFAGKERIIDGFERWYEPSRIRRLFDGLHILSEEYYVPHIRLFNINLKWLPASFEQISGVEDVVEKYGYQCNACYVVSPMPRRPI